MVKQFLGTGRLTAIGMLREYCDGSYNAPVTQAMLEGMFWDIRQYYGTDATEDFVGMVAGLPENIKVRGFSTALRTLEENNWRTNVFSPKALFNKVSKKLSAEKGPLAMFVAEHKRDDEYASARKTVLKTLKQAR